MSKKNVTYRLTSEAQFLLDQQEYEQSIHDAIEQFNLKSKSRDYLEYEVARLRLELEEIKTEPNIELLNVKSNFLLYKIYGKPTGFIRDVMSEHKRKIRKDAHSNSEIGIAKKVITDKYNARKRVLANEAHSKKFIRDMHSQHHQIMQESTIQKLVTKLNKTNEFIPKKIK